MITITTVGYGDIVPVSDQARLIDAFFVTPVRIFVWFIFLGTAYQFIIQRLDRRDGAAAARLEAGAGRGGRPGRGREPLDRRLRLRADLAPRLEEIGRNARDIDGALIVEVRRGGRRLGLWNDKHLRIEAGDRVLAIDSDAVLKAHPV